MNKVKLENTYTVILNCFDPIELEYIKESVKPWFKFENIKLCAILGRFKGSEENYPDYELGKPVLDFLKENSIKVIENKEFLEEHESRTLGLNYAKENSSDYLILLGADEIWDINQIKKLLNFVEKNKELAWFSINFKNYFHDKSHYVNEPFSPPRVYKLNYNGLKPSKFYYDDNLLYGDGINHIILPSILIPKNLIYVKHYSWLSDERSKRKIKYQTNHFPPPKESNCSYKWNDSENRIEFNKNFYQRIGKPLPEIINELEE